MWVENTFLDWAILSSPMWEFPSDFYHLNKSPIKSPIRSPIWSPNQCNNQRYAYCHSFLYISPQTQAQLMSPKINMWCSTYILWIYVNYPYDKTQMNRVSHDFSTFLMPDTKAIVNVTIVIWIKGYQGLIDIILIHGVLWYISKTIHIDFFIINIFSVPSLQN